MISATADELHLATTDDNIQENKADVTLRLATPLAAGKLPPPGSMLQGKWVGKATSYTPLPPQNANQGGAAGGGQQQTANNQQTPPAGCLPNTGGGVMLTLTDGAQQGVKKAAPPARKKKTTARRRR